jgi:hypothetical protein
LNDEENTQPAKDFDVVMDEAARALLAIVTDANEAVVATDRVKAFAEVAKWAEHRAKSAPSGGATISPFERLKTRAQGRGTK